MLQALGEPPVKSGVTGAELLKRPAVHYADAVKIVGESPAVTPFIGYCVEVELKYEGYIRRQLAQVKEVRRQEALAIPEGFDYASLAGVCLEAREKLARIRPRSLGQAARIPGVSPADIACLAVALKAQG